MTVREWFRIQRGQAVTSLDGQIRPYAAYDLACAVVARNNQPPHWFYSKYRGLVRCADSQAFGDDVVADVDQLVKSAILRSIDFRLSLGVFWYFTVDSDPGDERHDYVTRQMQFTKAPWTRVDQEAYGGPVS